MLAFKNEKVVEHLNIIIQTNKRLQRKCVKLKTMTTKLL